MAFVAVGCGLRIGAARAGGFELSDETWEGCSQLLELAQSELGEARVLVRASLDWTELGPNDGLLLLHPEQSLDSEEAAAFMKAGGRLAVLDDYAAGDELLSHFKIQRASLPERPILYLRGNPALPIAEPAVDTSGGRVMGLHPTVARVDRVMLNHGTGLVHPELTPVLEVRSVDGKDVVVAVAGQVEKGRLFAMGDPSAVINQMLRYPGNRRFASGLVQYLVDRDAEGGAGRLFLHVNKFEEKGAFGGTTPLRKAIDRKLKAIAEALAEARKDGLPWFLHVAVAAATGLLLLLWIGRVLLRAYRNRLPRFARPVSLLAQGGAPGRVAMLSAPTSPPAMTLLELRSAFCETVGEWLAAHPPDRAGTGGAPASRPPPFVPTPVRPEVLLDELEARAVLDDAVVGELRQALVLMNEAETAVVGGLPGRIGRGDVERATGVVRRALEALDRHFGVSGPLSRRAGPGSRRHSIPPPELVAGRASE
ncbi:MAG: DUF4350 domain-containing protein [Myxococcales bacterium]|nr:DUF4350 domain-containing protein [Myxococcales bacterium]